MKLILLVLAVVVASATAHGAEISKQEPNFCQGCRALVSFSQRFNSTDRRTEYMDLVKSFCELYYPASADYQFGSCPLFVQSLFFVLDRVDPVHHCDQIGACGPPSKFYAPPRKTQPINNDLPMPVSNVVCEVCETLIRQFQAAVEDPKVVDQLHRQADAFCDYLRAIGQDKECKQVINKYIDQAIDFVRNMKPLNYCQSIQLCAASSSTEMKLVKKPAQLPSLAAFNDFGIETSVSIGDQFVDKIDATVTNINGQDSGPTCMLCMAIVKITERFIKNNRTEENIRQSLDKVCSYMHKDPKKVKDCQEFVDAYAKEIVELLADESNPELVCMILMQCVYQGKPYYAMPMLKESTTTMVEPKKRPAVSMGEFISMLDRSIEVNSFRGCVECKLFIEYIKNTLQDPKSEDEFKVWITHNLCDRLEDAELKSSCNGVVEAYSGAFFKAVAEDLDPRATCTELGVCSQRLAGIMQLGNPLFVPQPPRISEVKHTVIDIQPSEELPTATEIPDMEVPATDMAKELLGDYCTQCVDTVTKIDDYIATHSVHDADVLVDEVCNKLPGTAKTECTFIVRAFGEDIVQIISTAGSPREVCEKIRFC